MCFLLGISFVGGLALYANAADLDKSQMDAIKEIADKVGTDTVLTKDQMIEELTFFAKAAIPFKGQKNTGML